MNAYKLFWLVAVLATISSCDKDILFHESNAKFQTVDQDEDIYAGLIGTGVEEAPSRNEIGCVDQNGNPGVKCWASAGSSCKKLTSCIAVSTEKFFSTEELANWPNVDFSKNRQFRIHLWEMGISYHPDDLDED